MMQETDNGCIEVNVHPDVILRAVEEYLNRHLFKEPLKVQRMDLVDYGRAYQVTAKTVLARLAGDDNNEV